MENVDFPFEKRGCGLAPVANHTSAGIRMKLRIRIQRRKRLHVNK